MLYIDDQIGSLDINKALETVGEQRRRYALRYRREHDRRLCLSAYLLLQQALRDQYGITSVPAFSFGQHGKPYFAHMPHIHFNISHCDDAVARVVDDAPVGVDVESIHRYDSALLPRTMSAEEQLLIAAARHPAEAFIKLWTMKESVLKLTGEGIASDLHTVLDAARRYEFETSLHTNYICTICRYAEHKK